MSETMGNILINYFVMEMLVTIYYSIIICGLFQANKKQRQGVFALYLFETFAMNLLMVFLRYGMEETRYIGMILYGLNTLGIVVLVSGMKYVLRAGYPKVLLSIFIGELSTSLVVVVVYLRIQKQFHHNFDSAMKLFSLPAMLLSTIIIMCLILLTVKFLYKPLGRFADMKVPVPFLFVLIFVIGYVAGAFTYIDFSWKSSMVVASAYSVIGLGILYLVNEWTRRRTEKEILLEYEALKQEKKAMEGYQDTIIFQEKKRKELQEKMEEQVKEMERYMKNNPGHHEVETYTQEFRILLSDYMK